MVVYIYVCECVCVCTSSVLSARWKPESDGLRVNPWSQSSIRRESRLCTCALACTRDFFRFKRFF